MNDTLTERRETRARRGWEPTPAEIAEECERIRATWSERERRRRGDWQSRWTVPEVSVGVELS